VADLGPAILAIVGTSIGGLIAAGAGIAQAKSQERIEEKRLAAEREAAQDARRAAEAAELRAGQAEQRAREREALVGLGQAVRNALQGTGATYDKVAEVRRLAYQVDDRELHDLVEAGNLRDGELLARAGYLIRTDPEDRTLTGHQDAASE
jgi:hypothetical protein